MRTEELIHEADAFQRDMSAYVHAELFNGERGAIIVAGEDKTIILTIYNIIESFVVSENPDENFRTVSKEVRRCIRALRKINRFERALGTPLYQRTEVDV